MKKLNCKKVMTNYYKDGWNSMIQIKERGISHIILTL